MTSQPWFGDLLDNIDVEGNTELPIIYLLSKAALLQEVIISTGPMRIKGDTTIYTADSFVVSANANVEELLKKLPGIQVDKDGKITALGETVQKVLVDGEEFFGDDPGMAVKNLRADAVKEVQVFDKKSEQAEFTGIDDGNTQKTINQKLKENAKKGYFGKVDVAGGPQKSIDNRYNTNLMGSSFKGKRKFSAFLLNGNTGQDGLGWEDEKKYGGFDNIVVGDDGGVMIFMGGGGSDGEPYVDTRNGFTTNTNAGIHYSNKWQDKYNLNLAPRYNEQQYRNNRKSFSQNPVEDSIFYINSLLNTNTNRHNIKLKGILDITMDSMNSVKITANNNYYQTESSTTDHSVTTGNAGTLKNSSDRQMRTKSDKQAFSGNIIFKHKFRKDRRTLSASADWGLINNKGTNFLLSDNKSYFDGQLVTNRLQDQMKNYESSTNNVATSLIYTEPLNKAISLELNYRLSYNRGQNDQFVYTPNGGGHYEKKVDSLSNEFKQTIIQNIPGAKINYSNKKLKANVGAGFGITNYELQDITFDKNYDRDYVNFYPTANITYTYKPNHSIRINYDGSSRQPGMNQLQPLRNNDDYFYQVLGNPNLKPSFSNTFQLNNNVYNFLKDFWAFQSLYFSFTNNQIVNNRIIDLDSGKTISRPENIDGNYYFSFYSRFSFKLKKPDLRFNIGPEISMSKSPVLINHEKNFTKEISPGLSVGLSKSKEKKYMINFQNTINYSYNSTFTPSKAKLKTEYFSNRIGSDVTVYLSKKWQLTTDYDYDFQGKTIESDKSIQIHLLNARLQRTFKNDEFTLYISANDILNQNQGISRNFYGGNYSEEINDRLKRYFLLGFRWDFKNKSANAK